MAEETSGLKLWTSVSGLSESRIVWTSRAILLMFAGVMFVMTWAAWPNLIIDCGREMYVPSALVAGKRLYRDVWYPYGPLAPWVNAVLFRVFGVSLNALYFSGLVVFAGAAFALHSIALRFVPPIVALVCGLGFLAQGFQSSLFNNILPYSYAATYGTFLCLLTLLFLIRYIERTRARDLMLAGVFAGLAVVCKFEAALPCAAGVAGVLLLSGWKTRRLALLLPGLLIPVCAYGWLLHVYGLEFLVHVNWMSMPGSYFMQRYAALWSGQTGLRFIPSETVRLSMQAAFVLLVWAGVAAGISKKLWSGLAAAALVSCGLAFTSAAVFPLVARHLYRQVTIGEAARLLLDDLAFPNEMFLIALGFAVFLIVKAFRDRKVPPATLLITIAMGLALAVRVMMRVEPRGYAIYSTPILFLVFLIVLWRVVGWAGSLVRPASRSAVVLACFTVYALLFVRMASALYTEWPWQLIHTPMGDVRRTPDHAELMTQFLPLVEEAKNRGERVLLLPELTGLYFIGRIEPPSRYEVLSPGLLEPGKYTDLYLHELERTSPDLIILSNRRSSEYGVDYFGFDYDQRVLQWIDSRYRVTGEIGHFERRLDAPLAALIYRRKLPSAE